jgi:oxazoline/thiazoline dehydrogenase
VTEAECGSPRRRLQIAAGVELDAGSVDQGPATIRSRAWSLPLGVLTPALRDAMVSLIDGSDEEAVASEVQRREGLSALGRWSWLAQALLDVGGLRCTLTTSAGDPLAAISALAPGATLRISPLGVSDSATLSRFACLRSLDGVAVIESPLGRARIELHDPRLAGAVAALARPSTAGSMAASIGLSVEALAAFLGFLRGARALAVPGETDAVAGAAGLTLWEFPDALFHAHSRLGRRTLAYGATYRFLGQIDPEPAVAPLEGRLIPLPTPNLPRLIAEDPPFAAILEVRRSTRAFARKPISFAALSEFLYRVARNTESPGLSARAGEYSRIKRPYPSAGACHPLEVYVAAPRCDDLELGLYRYEPASHGLVAMASDASRLAPLLASARSAAGIAENPPILIVVAARFARMLWKYEGIGYANTLKDAGGLLQTMYLVTTAMGLAGCALGGGDSECFSAAAGAGFFETSSIAEFMLGHPDQEAT